MPRKKQDSFWGFLNKRNQAANKENSQDPAEKAREIQKQQIKQDYSPKVTSEPPTFEPVRRHLSSRRCHKYQRFPTWLSAFKHHQESVQKLGDKAKEILGDQLEKKPFPCEFCQGFHLHTFKIDEKTGKPVPRFQSRKRSEGK